MPNRLACVLLFAFVALCLACAGMQPTTVPSTKKPDNAKGETSQDKKDKKDKQGDGESPPYKFGEKVKDGDLLVCVESATCREVFGEQHGKDRNRRMLIVSVHKENTSKVKIVDWDGWQNVVKPVDEHGNKYRIIDLDGWTLLRRNPPTFDKDNPGYLPDGDFSTRLRPETKSDTTLFLEDSPQTSKQLTITVPLNGKDVRFSGPIVYQK